MDSKRLAELKPRQHWVVAGCDPAVADGLRKFLADLTPSHSLTSHRYSAWALVKKWIDEPLVEYLATCQGFAARDLLVGLRPSRVGRHAPKRRARLTRDAGWLWTTGSTSPARSPDTPEVDWQLRNIRLWDSNLRAAIHLASGAAMTRVDLKLDDFLKSGESASAEAAASANRTDQTEPPCVATDAEVNRFCATLDSIRRLLAFLRTLRPKSSKNTNYKHAWQPSRVRDGLIRSDRPLCCELCWRPTMRSGRSRDSDGPLSPAHRYSDRFCSVHNPSDPSSSYQRDLYHRALFQHELDAASGGPPSLYAFHFPLPRSASEEEERKAIYDMVHAFPTRDLNAGTPSLSLPERVFVLHRAGHRKIDIARNLGISKQAVGRAFSKLDELLAIRANEAEIHPDTHESFSVLYGHSSQLFSDVRRLRKQGATTAQIAKQLHYFKHTIKAVCRWLDVPATPL